MIQTDTMEMKPYKGKVDECTRESLIGPSMHCADSVSLAYLCIAERRFFNLRGGERKSDIYNPI